MENLIQSLQSKDPAATLQAREIGPSANPTLIQFARNPDAKIRRIALYCLDETGGTDAARAFTEALLDDDSQVRGAALKGLHHHFQSASPGQLLQTYDRSPDPYARQQIMLVIARMNQQINPVEVKTRYDREADVLAKEGGLVALAHLNEGDTRIQFMRALQSSSGAQRLRFLEYCELLNDSWFFNALVPLLTDRTPAIRVAADARPDLIQNLRVCDVCVNIVSSISKHQFSFPINRATNYTSEQLDEVKAFLRGIHR
jgi:HEAT repeat protein